MSLGREGHRTPPGRHRPVRPRPRPRRGVREHTSPPARAPTARRRSPWNPTATAFAFAERLTGVRVTLSLLNDSTYLCGIVRIP
ncbi:DUF6461 domain-containing protein [Thermomonospora cellulosilytica]|uniref:DUF6461 domain-containing protein n=1 Tax=Thermomonospora cellulosilytica TaxID=1411118 RepID=UPI0035E41255